MYKEIFTENNLEVKFMKKKIACLILACLLVMTTSLVAACTRQKIDDVDSSKSTLWVNYFAGGFGKEWMESLEKRFEAAYADYSFEEGKKGVDIRLNPNKELGSAYLTKVDDIRDEVFFNENVDYYAWVKQGKVLDITDIVETSNSNDGGKSIASKMTDAENNYYKVDGKYYALPHHEHQTGLIYDVDLFESEELYFAEGGAPSEDYASDKANHKSYSGSYAYTGTGDKSAGPDGVHGTSDDGLPATYEEFFVLCDYMASKDSEIDITPFIWSGKNRADYTDWFLSEMAANYEGADQLSLNYTFSGTATNLISVDSTGKIVELDDTEINSDNGYMVYQSAGRYYALNFFKRLLAGSGKYFQVDDCFGSLEHTEAQYKYLVGATKTGNTRYAFLMDGCWWENEATDSFNSIVDRNGNEYSKTSRRFAFLSLPKATNEQIGDPFTIATTDVTLGFIKRSIDPSKIELAKTFLQFCYTDESLIDFNNVSGTPAAIDYTLSKAQYNALSSFGKSLYNVKDQVVAPYSTNTKFLNNNTKLNLRYTFTVGGKRAVETLRSDTMTAESFFKSLYTERGESFWKSL